MHILKSPLQLLTLLWLVTACNMKRLDTDKMRDLVESSEIKRVTPADINFTANLLGQQLTDSLNTFIAAEKPLNCNISDNAAIANLQNEMGVKIRLLGLKDTTAARLYDKEREVIDAYAYNALNGLPIAANLQKVGDSLLIYTASASPELQLAKTCLQDNENRMAVWSIVFPTNEVVKRVK